MKKIIALLLAVIMCLSMVACSETDESDSKKKDDKTDESEENKDTFRKKEDFVGRWCMYQIFYGADGRIQSHETQTLELMEDGSAELNVMTIGNDYDTTVYNTTWIKSWKYSKRNDLISFEVDGEEKTYSVCRSEDGSDAALGYGYIPSDDMYWGGDSVSKYVFSETFYRENVNCTICDPLPAGKYISEYGDMTVSEEGYITHNGEQYELNGIPCYGPAHYRYIENLAHFLFIPKNDTIVWYYGEFTRVTGEYIDFTADNWTDYFSENFHETFEVNYKVNYGKDTWGDYQVSLEGEIMLKDADKYVTGTNVTVEYTEGYFPAVLEYNTKTKEILNVTIDTSQGYIYDTPDTASLRYSAEEYYSMSGCLEVYMVFENEEIISVDGDVITVRFMLYHYPTAINRMQGILITAE